MKSLLEKMTLNEKSGQLNQRLYGWEVYDKKDDEVFLTQKFKDEVKKFDGIGAIYGIYRSDPWSDKNLETGLNVEEGLKVIKMINDYIQEHTRLKIPPLITEEVPHGLQAIYATTLPSNISLGQTWNPKLVEEAQKVAGYESAVRGVHLALISCLDVARDPRWGRTEECFSEDPHLTKMFAKHSILGLQTYGSYAVAKHFAAQGSAQGGLNAAPASIGERELREIHIPPLEGIVEANCKMMMASYNEIDGILCHDNPWLLRNLAKEEFGFQGGYMADGVALDRLSYLTNDPVKAAARALKAGIDLSLWDDVYPNLEEAVLKGYVSEELLDEAVLRILEMKQDLGLFDDPKEINVPKPETQVLDKLAEESFVLLKNNNKLLPLKQKSKIALVGPNAHAVYNQCGDYTPYKDLSQCTSVLEGLETYFDVSYAQGSEITRNINNGFEQALKAAKDAEVIVVAFGGSSARDFNTVFDANGAAIDGSHNMTCGENIDVSDLSIPKVQVELIKALSTLNKPMVGLLVQGRPHAIDQVEGYFDALINGGYPGQNGGRAFSKILSGIVNPSGKMAMSIPKNAHHIPSYYNYKKSFQNEKYIDLNPKSDYPFGFGLSYSSFKFKDVQISSNQISKASPEIKITGQIHNESSRDGMEVVQVYIHHIESSVIQRVQNLKAFTKLKIKAHGASTFEMSLNLKDFEVWSRNKIYELEPGETHITVAIQNQEEIFKIIRK